MVHTYHLWPYICRIDPTTTLVKQATYVRQKIFFGGLHVEKYEKSTADNNNNNNNYIFSSWGLERDSISTKIWRKKTISVFVYISKGIS